MDYEVTLYLRQVWKDDRLAFGKLTNQTMTHDRMSVESELLDDIWRPNIFFVQEKRAMKHTVLRPNTIIDSDMHVSTNTTFSLSLRSQVEKWPRKVGS
mgnify:CR=1 FL=1